MTNKNTKRQKNLAGAGVPPAASPALSPIEFRFEEPVEGIIKTHTFFKVEENRLTSIARLNKAKNASDEEFERLIFVIKISIKMLSTFGVINRACTEWANTINHISDRIKEIIKLPNERKKENNYGDKNARKPTQKF